MQIRRRIIQDTLLISEVPASVPRRPPLFPPGPDPHGEHRQIEHLQLGKRLFIIYVIYIYVVKDDTR